MVLGSSSGLVEYITVDPAECKAFVIFNQILEKHLVHYVIDYIYLQRLSCILIVVKTINIVIPILRIYCSRSRIQQLGLFHFQSGESGT